MRATRQWVSKNPKAWDGYIVYRKSPRRQPGGSEFAEPGYELPLEWLATRASIRAAEERAAGRTLGDEGPRHVQSLAAVEEEGARRVGNVVHALAAGDDLAAAAALAVGHTQAAYGTSAVASFFNGPTTAATAFLGS